MAAHLTHKDVGNAELRRERNRPCAARRLPKNTVFQWPAKESGFSLLEILVAFSILALSLGVLLEIFSTSLRGVTLGDQYSKAALVAESRLAALGADIPIEAGTYEGEEGDLYRWRVSLTPYPDEDLESVEPFTVEVEVRWDDFGRERRISLTSLRLGAAEVMR